MFRSAYRLWKKKYPQGWARFIILIFDGHWHLPRTFGFGVAYITGAVQAQPAEPQLYRQEGIGLCVAGVVSLLAFLLAVRWYAHQDGAEDDATAP